MKRSLSCRVQLYLPRVCAFAELDWSGLNLPQTRFLAEACRSLNRSPLRSASTSPFCCSLKAINSLSDQSSALLFANGDLEGDAGLKPQYSMSMMREQPATASSRGIDCINIEGKCSSSTPCKILLLIIIALFVLIVILLEIRANYHRLGAKMV